MSWSPLEPIARSSGNFSRTKPQATASLSSGSSRIGTTRGAGWRLNVMIYGQHIDTPPPWLVDGGKCQAEAGDGEHAGAIRITPGSVFTLRRVSRSALCFKLVLPVPPVLAHQRRDAVPVEIDWTDDWVEITLPASWRTGDVAAPPATPRPPGTTLLDPRILSHPQWASPKARAEHEAALAEAAAR
jgi:hypothetical protein